MRTLAERFWEKVQKTDDCWLWAAARATPNGHCVIRVDGRLEGAHRVSWRIHNGEIPDAIEVCHACDNPPCVRPDHLFLGTHAENMADRDRKGRLVTPMGAHETRKTHCPQGHAYDEANTYIKPSNSKRGCRTCHRARAERQRRADGREKGARKGRFSGKTHCDQGHQLILVGGRKKCRICHRDYVRARRARH